MTNLCGGEDVLDRLRDLRANTVTLDQADQEVALRDKSAKTSPQLTEAKHCVERD
jgi:hypothetical protein